ncbi:Mobilization protein [Pseudomonas savastanoi pv. glycinea]|uniref:Mobilization protein n=1 Tax=Pseudomonas savastanoi pv. glycinea TaxID=318 RepID=A0AB74ASH9_PSESG|nr:Mobilization protein [Pseudomonas savastanoi pv. glycinea]RMN13497.1 TraA [Pseudomonas savastanoi pv. glycinea]RMP90015.1 Mobilization protein [Pseudomonas savastanoi pv. glycinea]RMQ02731.1 Mobilization protein [Pseudomonas savastanoi pv. glycinea]RMR20542.1 Mobilization protein [Pseudomonas savastanoi pv. glycinea]
MAIFHASTKPIARSAGRSSVAAAAYRSGTELVDMRTGLVHDYTRRGGVVSTEIMLPDGTSAERNALWNAAESAEKRKDGRTGREWIIALPAELDDGARQELASAFGIELATRYGVAVDLAIHLPDREGDNRNHHAHVMTTTRQVSRDAAGLLVMGEKSTIELSDTKRRGMGLGSGADEVVAIRQLWERMANRALENAGSDARIDSRSLKAQGLDREATTHLGPVASDMERRNKASDRGDGNRQVAANNALREQISAQILDLTAFRAARQAAPVTPAHKTRSKPVRLPDNPLPVYARNPRKMATLGDISMRGARLFGPLKAAAEKDQANESGADLLRPEVKAAWNARRAPGTAAVTAAEPEVNATDSVRTHWNPRTAIAPQPTPVPASSETPKPTERPRPNARPAITALFAEWRQERGTEKHVAAEAPANIDPQPLSYRERMDAIKARRALRQSDQPPVAPDAAQRTLEPVKPVIDPHPQLTGSAAMRARLGVDESRNVDPRGVRERMSALMDRMQAQVNGQLPLPKVESAPQPNPEPVKAAPVVPAPEPVKPVISAARLELDALKASVVPIESVVAADPRVIAAQKEYDRVKADLDRATEMPRKEAEWRAEHPKRAWLHDKGIKKSTKLEYFEKSLRDTQYARQNAHLLLSSAQMKVSNAQYSASWLISQERNRSPVMQRIDQLEAVVMAEEAASAPTTDASRAQVHRSRSKPTYRPQRDYSPDQDQDEPGMDF